MSTSQRLSRMRAHEILIDRIGGLHSPWQPEKTRLSGLASDAAKTRIWLVPARPDPGQQSIPPDPVANVDRCV